MPLSSEAKALLEMVYRVGAPRFHELSVEQARHSFRKMQLAFQTDPPVVSSVTRLAIIREDRSRLHARFYKPAGIPPESRLPLIIYFHGGGWCVGDTESYDVLCRQLAIESGCAVLSVDYRLAPEHPFPAAVEDAIFSLEWAAAHAASFGADPDRIVLAGDSAGGNLGIVAALLALRRGSVAVRFMALIYPSTEIISNRSSRHRFAEGYLLDRASLEWFYARYLQGGEAFDWRASPMLAESLRGLPPMLLVTAECDPLVDDCIAFAERVRAEGGSVEHLAVPAVVHGFLTLGKFFPQAGPAIRHIGASVRRALARSR